MAPHERFEAQNDEQDERPPLRDEAVTTHPLTSR